MINKMIKILIGAICLMCAGIWLSGKLRQDYYSMIGLGLIVGGSILIWEGFSAFI